jgi:hypothetical protein
VPEVAQPPADDPFLKTVRSRFAAIFGLETDQWWFDLQEASLLIGISYSSLRNAIKTGRVKAFKIGGVGKGVYRVSQADLVEYMEACRVGPPSRRQVRPAPTGAGCTLRHLKLRTGPRDASPGGRPR